MRFLWAGLIVLSLASDALAQANGYVRELGFAGNYRPDCWVPLLVHLESTVSEPAEYLVQVHQQDLDQDSVVFTRTVTLGPQARENVWVYFQPQPTGDGLPGPTSLAQLGDVLKVHLYDKSGKRHIANLPVQAKASSLDEGSTGLGSDRAIKLVLVIHETGNYHHQEYVNAQGLMEDVLFVPVRLDQSGLPDHVLGYQMVDAVLWLDAKLNTIRNTPSFGALQQWIRQGGNFAVCQQTDRGQLDALIAGDMLPVVGKTGPEADAAWAIQLRQKQDLDHLRALVVDTTAQVINDGAWKAVEAAHPSFEVAFAQPRPDAMVEAWITWSVVDGQEERSPLIARRPYGMGSVTWVAQALGSSVLNGAPDPADKPGPNQQPRMLLTNGWPRIWDRVFGWRNQTRSDGEVAQFKAQKSDQEFATYANQYMRGSGVDIGLAMLHRGIEHGARSTAYVFVAVLFFVIYWIIAGPGSYLYLASRKKKGLSWTVFAASALAATLLTVLLVKLLLRGGAEVRHVTLVQLYPEAAAADGTAKFAAQMHTRMGLYIPRDGEQTVSLAAPGPEKSAYVAPFAVHPQWLKADKDAGFTDTAKYYVDTDPILAGKSPTVGFPFRSTLKKVEAGWAGSVPEGIVGTVSLSPPGSPSPLAGTLTNKLGRDLSHVFLAFTSGWIDASDRRRSRDIVLYLPSWKNGESRNLANEFLLAKPIEGPNAVSPGYGSDNVQGTIEPATTRAWSRFWFDGLTASFGSEVVDDRSRGYLRTFPLMALIDRVGPLRRDNNSDTRPEPIRRGGRNFNASQLVAAGRLVVLAHAVDAPVPLPMQVNGDDFQSQGVTFYEIALPLDRAAVKPVPATQAATKPSTRPAGT